MKRACHSMLVVPAVSALLSPTNALAVALAAVPALTCSHEASAALIGSWTIGEGASTSTVQIQFANGNTYLYDIRYDGALTGQDLFERIAAAQPGYFAYEVTSFSFGDALFGIAIGSDANSGFGNPPAYLDYWHYWTRSAGTDAWTESFVGFGDRTVGDGSWDGWVFDSSDAPGAVPAPGALAMLLLAGAKAGRRRR